MGPGVGAESGRSVAEGEAVPEVSGKMPSVGDPFSIRVRDLLGNSRYPIADRLDNAGFTLATGSEPAFFEVVCVDAELVEHFPDSGARLARALTDVGEILDKNPTGTVVVLSNFGTRHSLTQDADTTEEANRRLRLLTGLFGRSREGVAIFHDAESAVTCLSVLRARAS